jgi:hypothetical protein
MIPLREIGKALSGSAVPASPQASARGICKGFVRTLQLLGDERRSTIGVREDMRVSRQQDGHGGES